MSAIKEQRNSEIFLRPRFSIQLERRKEHVLTQFKEALNLNTTKLRGTFVDDHIFISVPKKEEHFWSPQLQLELLETSDNKTTIKGLFGPKPQVWTLFMFVHFIVGISFLGFLVLLFTRISLDETIVFPIVMLLFLPLLWIFLYFLGKIGKETGKDQMKILHDFVVRNC